MRINEQQLLSQSSVDEDVTLYVTAGTIELSTQLRDVLRADNLEISQAYPQVFKLICRGDELQLVSSLLAANMTLPELNTISFHLAVTGK